VQARPGKGSFHQRRETLCCSLCVWLAAAGATAPPLHAGPPAPIAPPELAARRGRVLEAMARNGESSVLLLRAPPPDHFAGDVDYPYRPENDIYYLTGIAEPGCTLLLSTKEIEGKGKEVLFVDLPSAAGKVWVGEPFTLERARELSGLPAEAILGAEGLQGSLGNLAGATRRFHDFHGPAPPSKRMTLFFDEGRGFRPGDALAEPQLFLLKSFGSRAFHFDLRPPGEVTHRLRQVKSPAELRLIQEAVDATVKALEKAMRGTRPGTYEYQLRGIVEGTFLEEGGGWGFPPIIASGPNTCILHYPRYDRKAEDGDLFLLDIGADRGFYSADVSRTFPVNGKFTARQREIYEVVLEAQAATIRAIRPDLPFHEVNQVARREVAAGLKRLGLIREEGEVGKYLPHGASHGLGLDVHDPMPDERLAAGMVITVEPGVYIPDEGLGVRIEDDVLVTEDGARVLSAGAPRNPAAIEALMAETEF
jgi:Xaa-Pro aminopeptidase